MKFTAFAFMSFAATGIAQTAQKATYKCETSEGSPLLDHTRILIDNMKAEDAGEQWCNEYGLGSDDCGGTIKKYSGKEKGAALMMCKGDGDEQTFRVSPPSTLKTISRSPFWKFQ